jgi:glycosyltransferase involved in cell wall biosynthesis
MVNLVAFRPGVISQRTEFKVQTLIYKYLQKHYDYSFTIVKSDEENYQDPAFQIITLPQKVWKGRLSRLGVPKLNAMNRYLNSIFAQASGVLTVDPTIYPQGLLAIQNACRFKKPVWMNISLTVRDVPQDFTWALKRRFWIRKAFYQTQGIIVTVPKCIERFQDIGLFDEVIAPKLSILGHPIDTQKFIPKQKLSEKDGILRVLVISRMIPEKGFLYILEAMTPLLRVRSNLVLQFLGSGPMRPLLEAEVTERGLSEKVTFLNSVSHQEIPNILGAADIFVNHAVSIGRWEEYFGIANLEAMSCGLPCVLTACGGIPYAIREKDVALFVEERNIVQLREAISCLVDSEQKRLEMGQRGRHYVEGYYALPMVAEKFHRILQEGFTETSNLTPEK